MHRRTNILPGSFCLCNFCLCTCNALFYLCSSHLLSQTLFFPFPSRPLLQPPCVPADEGVDEGCLAQEALRVEQLEEVEIRDLEGAPVQVQHRSLLGLRSAMSFCCPASVGGSEPFWGHAVPWEEQAGLGTGRVSHPDVPIPAAGEQR